MELKTKFRISSLFVLISLIIKLNAFLPPEFVRRFEYKLSFKGPHLIFRDGTIPFWEFSGNAIASNDQVRITPSIKSQKGRIWTKNQMANPDWEIEVIMRVNGRGRVGADGMAIWYTEKMGTDGPVFGSNDNWNGLGIFLDSFDNDGQQNNPYISVMINDGTKQFDHHRDGITQQLGGCLRDFRNKPFPIRIKVEYFRKALTVLYHGGLSNDLSHYEICTRIENVELPKTGHFGVSAATGGLADDHDVLAFITHTFIDHKNIKVNEPTQEEKRKYDKEYEEFMKQLEAEKEKYRKEHPEQQQEVTDEKKLFENEQEKEFRAILDAQNQIRQIMGQLDSKISEILGKQNHVVSMVSSLQATGIQAPNQQQQPQQGGAVNQGALHIDTFKRDEVNHIMNQQNELVRTIRDIYQSISDVHRKTNYLHDSAASRAAGTQQGQPIASQAQANSIDPSMLQQINEGVKNLKFEMSNLVNRNQQQRCPEVQSCLSTFYFISIITLQTVLFLAYFLYKNRADSHSKKFY